MQEEVRQMLKSADVARLTGLLAHLLHWIALMPVRAEGPQLSESALQSLFVAVHKHWSKFEKMYRDSKLGVSFALPCLMLTLKRGIERSFEISYPTLMSHELLRQQVTDRINTLLMRLFDPDSIYTRFGKFDGEGKAILLSKKLDALMAHAGTTQIRRLHGRMHRSTPLVRAVLGLSGQGEERGAVADTKTRVMMLQSDLGGTVPTGSVVRPPEDVERQTTLFKAAIDRLPFQGQYDGAPPSARQAQGTRRTKLLGSRSARGPTSSSGAEVDAQLYGTLSARGPASSSNAEKVAPPSAEATLPRAAAAEQARAAASGKPFSNPVDSASPGDSRNSTKSRYKTQLLPPLRSANTQRRS